MLERAANQVVRDRISKVRARLSDLKSGRKKAPGILARAHGRLAEANEEFDSAEAKLAEISGKLKGIKFDEIAEREQRRDDLRNEIRDIDRNIGSLTINVQNAERDAIRISAEITRLAKEDEQTIVFGRRLSLCEDIKSKLEQQLSESAHNRNLLPSVPRVNSQCHRSSVSGRRQLFRCKLYVNIQSINYKLASHNYETYMSLRTYYLILREVLESVIA